MRYTLIAYKPSCHDDGEDYCRSEHTFEVGLTGERLVERVAELQATDLWQGEDGYKMRVIEDGQTFEVECLLDLEDVQKAKLPVGLRELVDAAVISIKSEQRAKADRAKQVAAAAKSAAERERDERELARLTAKLRG